MMRTNCMGCIIAVIHTVGRSVALTAKTLNVTFEFTFLKYYFIDLQQFSGAVHLLRSL